MNQYRNSRQTSDQLIYTVRHRQIELRFDPITDQLSALVEDHDGLCLSLYREPGSELPVGLIRERILKWGQAQINLTAVPAGAYLLFVTTVPFELTWDGNHQVTILPIYFSSFDASNT